MENHHFQWENPLQITIFNSYVSLPEGKVSIQGWGWPARNSRNITKSQLLQLIVVHLMLPKSHQNGGLKNRSFNR